MMRTDTTPPEKDSRGALITLLSAFLLAAVLTGAGLIAAHRYRLSALEDERDRRAAEQAAAVAERGIYFVGRTGDPIGSLGPLSPAWDEVPALELTLQKQNIAMPMLEEVTVSKATVRGLTDGRVVAWRVSWPDLSPDANVDTGRFCDAVALQFPLVGNAAFTMGEHRQPVQILHWKALWQKDVDEHFQDVQDLHPNYWTDLYWFAEGEFPYRVPDDFSDPRSHAWFVARQAGNPLADFERRVPVEELFAEGYGSLTAQPESVTIGGGAWREGAWHVVFARPQSTEDPLDYQFGPGDRGVLSVAVWNGSAANVGGRKQWSNWTDFEVSH